MGRWVAKNIVAAGLAAKCEIQFAYAIGHPLPVSVHVDTFGTGTHQRRRDPRGRAEGLLLQARRHREAAQPAPPDLLARRTNYGHFGKIDDTDLTWERTDKADALKKAAK